MTHPLRILPTPHDRRRDGLQRTLLWLVQYAIERGDLTAESAAMLLLRHDVPMRVARDVIARAQGRDVPAEWPELCEAVMPRVEPVDHYTPFAEIRS